MLIDDAQIVKIETNNDTLSIFFTNGVCNYVFHNIDKSSMTMLKNHLNSVPKEDGALNDSPEVVKEFPCRKKTSEYSKYFDGQIWKIKLTGTTRKEKENQRMTFTSAANYLGIKLRTQFHEGYIYLQAIDVKN